jgi:hypothetical protein
MYKCYLKWLPNLDNNKKLRKLDLYDNVDEKRQTNYITNLDAWRIESVAMGSGPGIDTPPAFAPDPENQGVSDDLPF